MFPLFATSVIDTGGKFAAVVVDTGGKLPPMLLTPAANLPLELLTTTLAKSVAKFATGVVDTGGQFACYKARYSMTINNRQFRFLQWGKYFVQIMLSFYTVCLS